MNAYGLAAVAIVTCGAVIAWAFWLIHLESMSLGDHEGEDE
jgi:hypothetical protein